MAATATWVERLVPLTARFGPGVLVIGLRLVGAGLGLVAQVLASRLIGAEAFGQYALMLVWLLLLGHGASAGTNQLICRYLAHHLARDELEAPAGLLRFSLFFAGSVAVALALGAIGLVQSGLLGLEPGTVALATLAFSVIPLLALQDFLEAIARGLDRPNLGIGPTFLLRNLAIICGVSALMVLGVEADALFVMALTVVGLVLSVAAQWALIYRHVRTALHGARPAYSIRRWIKTALPIAMIEACEVLFYNADILVLGLFVPPEMVAFYFAATRIAQILAYVPYGISAVTAQKYAALAAAGRHDGIQRLVAGATVATTGMAALAALVFSILAAPLLTVFGPGYETAAYVVPVLCLGIVATCMLGPGEDVLNMLGEERICSTVFMMSVGANVALNFALIPFYGILGAAMATAIALALRSGMLAWFAYSRLGLALPLGSHLLSRGKSEA